MKALTFEITGRVASAKNSTRRAMVRGRMLTLKSEAARDWQNDAVAQLMQQRPEMKPITEPVRLTIQFHGPIAHPHSVDGDNGEGAIWDALKKARIIADDKPRIGRGCTWDYVDAPYPNWKVVLMVAPYHVAQP